jgi:hypothetical protein
MQALFLTNWAVLHYLLSLGSNYIELRTETPHFRAIQLPDSCMISNASFCEISVRMPKTNTETITIVSPEDYRRLLNISENWRVNTRGYVVTSSRPNGKYRMTYMHKEVAGHTATHLNGDRLDNRRANLVPSKPRSPPIMVSRPPIMDHIYNVADLTRPDSETHQTIQYTNGKVYSGEIHNGIPHGLGTLIEKDRSTFGWFLFGQFRSGIVLDHPRIPERLHYLYQAQHLRPIQRGFVVLKNGTHVDIRGDDKDH